MTSLRLIAYAPLGASLGALPDPISCQASYPLNDLGALTLEYHPEAARSSLLGQPLEIVTEVSSDGGATWSEPPNGRFIYLRDGRDPIKTEDAYAIECTSYAWRLQKALVGTSGLDSEGKRPFTDYTPGAILRDLFDGAQGRGALSGMARTWNGNTDSNGNPWPLTFSISYDPGANLLGILQAMVDDGWVDFSTQGRSLNLYYAGNPDGLSRDQTTGAAPVVLRYGRDLTEAPFRRTWEGLADTAIVLGDEGKTVTRINPAAQKPWGVQETFVTASGVTDDGTLNTLGDAALTFTDEPRAEHTLGLEFAAAAHLPFRDYRFGDWVSAATSGAAAPTKMRVRAITLVRNNDGSASGNVTLNDRFLEADVLQTRRIARILNGATQTGGGGTPGGIGPDILAPGIPAGLAASSAAYVEQPDGRIRAQITLNWNDVTTNADGTPTNDVATYEVWARRPGVDDWRLVATTTVSEWYSSGYEPGVTWEFRVRAVDASVNFGGFSATASTTTAFDLTPPPQPSTPTATSRLGTARITWDGLTVGGGNMAATVPDWRYVTVHVSTVNGFTPSAANRVGELTGPGYVVAGPLDYSTTYYARLVAYDSSGNASTGSAQVVVVVAPLVDVSNFPDTAMEALYARTGQFLDLSADNFSANLIEGAWVKAGAISVDKLTVGAQSGENLVPNGDFQDLNTAGTQPLMWSTTPRNGAGGTLGVETTNAIGGTRSALVTMAAAADGAYLRSTPVPCIPGLTYVVTVKFRTNSTISGIPALSMGTAPTGSDPRNNLDGAVTWTSAFNLTAPAPNTVVTLTRQVTVPANHKSMAVIVSAPPNTGGGYSLIVDSAMIYLAVPDSAITDVSAGKIRTGIIQATERIIAGTMTGARAEMNGVGFQAFNPSGTKMFEVQANSGDTYVGDPSGFHVRLGAYGNVYSGQNQGMLRFGTPTGSGWGDGQISGYYYGDGSGQWGAVRIASPYGANLPATWGNAAYLDLRSRSNDGYSQFFLRANEANFSANTFIFGSGDGTTIDFRNFGSSGFTLSKYDMTQRINIYWQVGFNLIRSIDASGNAIQMRLQGNPLALSAGGHEVYWNVQFAPTLGHFERNVGLAFYGGQLGATDFVNGGYRPFLASAFNVNSDPRVKSNAKRVRGALDALDALEVYDYDADGLLPQVAPRQPSTRRLKNAAGKTVDQVVHKRGRGRGVMADQTRDVLPDAVHEDEQGRLSVSLYDLLATTMAAVQELSAKVKALESPTP